MTQKFSFTIIALLVSQLLIFGQDQSFSVSLTKDTLLLGNTLEIKFVANNIDGQFEAPNLNPLNVISGPNMASNMQYINGSTQRSSTYSYWVKPTEIGAYIIEPAYLISNTENYETDPIELIVIPNPDGIIDEHRSEDSFFEFPQFNFEFNFPDRDIKEKEIKKDTLAGRTLKRI